MSAPPGDAGEKKGYAYECMMDGNCRRVFADCEAAGRCLAAAPMAEVTTTLPGDAGERARGIVCTFWRGDEWGSNIAGYNNAVNAVEVALQSERTADASREARAYAYLKRLLSAVAPQCKPLPDLIGLCTQIDSAIVWVKEQAASQARRETWRPIETYPREWEPGAETWWGPNALLFVASGSIAPASDYRILTGRLEADMWLGWNDDGAMHDLAGPPTHWQPLPEPPRALATPQESAS